MFIYSKKIVAWDQQAARVAHFNGVVQLALGVDRFRGALEMPETWEIVGLRRPQAHLTRSQSAHADRFTHPRHPSEPVTAIRLEHVVSLDTATTDVFSIRPYISYLASRSMRQRSYFAVAMQVRRSSAVGVSKDTMVLI